MPAESPRVIRVSRDPGYLIRVRTGLGRSPEQLPSSGLDSAAETTGVTFSVIVFTGSPFAVTVVRLAISAPSFATRVAGRSSGHSRFSLSGLVMPQIASHGRMQR